MHTYIHIGHRTLTSRGVGELFGVVPAFLLVSLVHMLQQDLAAIFTVSASKHKSHAY